MTNVTNNDFTLLNTIHDYNIDLNNREIYLHSYMSDESDEAGVDYRSAIVFEKKPTLP